MRVTDPTPLVVAAVLVVVALHVWYAVMLGRVLERLGADGWRAWVPLLNQAEVLRLGGVPPVAAVLLIVPVVQLVGLALVGVAASRLNAHFGRGAGATALAVLAPPVWATLLAGAATDAGRDSRVAQTAAWAASATEADVSHAPATNPTSAIEPPARILPPAGGVPFVPAAPAERIVPPPGLLTPPPAVDPDPVERTVVVERRPAASWSLQVEGGPRLPLAGDRVVLGRRPLGAGGEAVELELPDPTRTLSKVHARLDFADGRWTITDLHATNGVIVVDEHGAERLLDPGETAPVVERVLLGRVAVRILADEGDA